MSFWVINRTIVFLFGVKKNVTIQAIYDRYRSMEKEVVSNIRDRMSERVYIDFECSADGRLVGW